MYARVSHSTSIHDVVSRSYRPQVRTRAGRCRSLPWKMERGRDLCSIQKVSPLWDLCGRFCDGFRSRRARRSSMIASRVHRHGASCIDHGLLYGCSLGGGGQSTRWTTWRPQGGDMHMCMFACRSPAIHSMSSQRWAPADRDTQYTAKHVCQVSRHMLQVWYPLDFLRRFSHRSSSYEIARNTHKLVQCTCSVVNPTERCSARSQSAWSTRFR
ncbi:hypothetical protein K466DRAFT_29719 [Polyporus arcularius HHB13444]|uniref:Uncharacterized protein n=1 Tax=Polyporus arcularius HHB13444 TaxID=1314778 RepID=A0A5C3NTA5_9APHY|nr:hypothetical protein K466DRAFT_29719 [Polyporus arcularius HHB13444]